MDKSIELQNKNFIIEWIKTNPNFSGLNFYNNSIIFTNGSKIELSTFLISSLLKNPNISSNIYSMDEYLFYKILYANTEIYKFYDINDKNLEYIKTIKLTTWGTSYIVTNSDSSIEITEVKPIELISLYNSLKNKKGDKPVSINELYKKLNKTTTSSEKRDVLFFDLINKTEVLNPKEKEYINDFSKYMYTLTCYQDYLVDDAKNYLELYNHKMNYLLELNDINENQKMALNLYDANLRTYELKTKKETFQNRKASIGFSSLALIVISVVVTLSLIVLLIIIH